LIEQDFPYWNWALLHESEQNAGPAEQIFAFENVPQELKQAENIMAMSIGSSRGFSAPISRQISQPPPSPPPPPPNDTANAASTALAKSGAIGTLLNTLA